LNCPLPYLGLDRNRQEFARGRYWARGMLPRHPSHSRAKSITRWIAHSQNQAV
jgi:hypothetical protein